MEGMGGACLRGYVQVHGRPMEMATLRIQVRTEFLPRCCNLIVGNLFNLSVAWSAE